MAGIQDFVNGSVLTETAIDEVAKQAIPQYATAAARDADALLSAALREGLMVYLLNSNTLTVYTGSAWSTVGPVHGAETGWTPVITQSNVPTLTVSYATYSRVGRRIHANMLVTCTSAGTAANPIVLTGMPTCAAGIDVVGSGRFVPATGTNHYTVLAYFVTSTSIQFLSTHNTTAPANMILGSGSNAFTGAIASGDFLSVQLSYVAAADA